MKWVVCPSFGRLKSINDYSLYCKEEMLILTSTYLKSLLDSIKTDITFNFQILSNIVENKNYFLKKSYTHQVPKFMFSAEENINFLDRLFNRTYKENTGP